MFAKGYGTANLEHGVPITPSTVFDVASNSKQFTAFAILLLESRGKLSFDDQVLKYVPELSGLKAPIKVRHLIHNTSGLWGIGDVLEVTGQGIDRHFNRTQFLDHLRNWREVSFPPGERYQYSNTNWILLGLIVERIDGRSLGKFLSDEVFVPLGMRETVVRDDPGLIVPGRASNYTPATDGGYRMNTAWALTEGLAGMAFIHTTINDIAKWDRNFYTAEVGGKEVVGKMYIPGKLNSGKPIHYAAGVKIGEYRGLKYVYHGGLGGGTSEIMRFPDEKLTVSVFCNQYYTHTDSWSLALSVAEVFLESRMTKGTEPDCRDLSRGDAISGFQGLFWVEEQFRRASFVLRGGCLVEVSEGEENPLEHLGGGEFQDDLEKIILVKGSDGSGVHRPTGEQYRLTRLDEGFRPGDLKVYEGDFYSPEINLKITFRLYDGDLMIDRRSVEPERLVPQRKDIFEMSSSLVEFFRDGDGRISHVEISSARMNNLKFYAGQH